MDKCLSQTHIVREIVNLIKKNNWYFDEVLCKIRNLLNSVPILIDDKENIVINFPNKVYVLKTYNKPNKEIGISGYFSYNSTL